MVLSTVRGRSLRSLVLSPIIDIDRKKWAGAKPSPVDDYGILQLAALGASKQLAMT